MNNSHNSQLSFDVKPQGGRSPVSPLGPFELARVEEARWFPDIGAIAAGQLVLVSHVEGIGLVCSTLNTDGVWVTVAARELPITVVPR